MAGWDDSDFSIDSDCDYPNNFLTNVLCIGLNPNKIVAGKYKRKKPKTRSSPLNDVPFTTIDGNPVRTLYVTRIPAWLRWNDVHSAFSEYGEIKKLYLKTNARRPFAFVTFSCPEVAFKVLNEPRVRISGYKVNVAVADSWHQPVQNSDGSVDWSNLVKKNTEMDDEEDENVEVLVAINVEATTTCSIDMLNDDCLSHVFSFLNYKERLGVERVCKRWQAVNFSMWLRVHALDFSSPLLECVPLTLTSLQCLLKRCNDSLKKLIVLGSDESLDSRSLFLISKYCRNIEELCLTDLAVNNRSLPHLAKYCTKLKKIRFDECDHFTDSDLLKWFSKSTSLTSVSFIRARGIKGYALTALKTPLEALSLNECSKLNPELLIACLNQNSDSLKVLSLNAIINLRSNDIDHIVRATPNLTCFSLQQSCPLFNTKSLLPIGNLAHLRELDLKYNGFVTDDVVAAIVEGCKELKFIDLSGPRREEDFPLTGEGIAKLGKMHKLEILNISYLNQTTDTCLKNLTVKSPRLKSLICIGCPCVSDDGCTQVVSLCNELELFNLSGNVLVTNETVQTALASVKLCTNRKPLELIIGGTAVDSECFDENEKRLIINMTDHCEDHLRPDFIDNMFFPPSDDDDDLDLLYHGFDYPIMAFEEFFQNECDDSDLETDTDYDDSLSDDDEIVFKCF